MCAKTSRKKTGELEREPPSKLKSFIIGFVLFAAILCPFTVALGVLAKFWRYTGGGVICGLPAAFLIGVAISLPFAIIFANRASK